MIPKLISVISAWAAPTSVAEIAAAARPLTTTFMMSSVS
jgi:hypothetical protein